jgi:hypothetical protein
LQKLHEEWHRGQNANGEVVRAKCDGKAAMNTPVVNVFIASLASES